MQANIFIRPMLGKKYEIVKKYDIRARNVGARR